MAMAAESIDAELRLGLPGSGGGDVGAAAKKRRSASSTVKSEASGTACCGGAAARDVDDGASPASKVQVVGWPPVGSYRRSTFQSSSTAAAAAAAKGKGAGETDQGRKNKGGGLYVKVSMDGAPYLRKVDLRMYGGYRELRDALDALFGCFSADASASAAHFAVAYEDKDGDLMLAGDVPWDMFISSCKKLRIMRGSEAR